MIVQSRHFQNYSGVESDSNDILKGWNSWIVREEKRIARRREDIGRKVTYNRNSEEHYISMER